MPGVNKVILVGRLGKDPEMRYLQGGISVARFTLATSEIWVRDGVKTETTEWHTIVMWRGLADLAEKFLTKGKLIYLEGKIRSRSWTDQEGLKRYATEIEADHFTMLDRKGEDVEEKPLTREPHTLKGDETLGDFREPDLPF